MGENRKRRVQNRFEENNDVFFSVGNHEGRMFYHVSLETYSERVHNEMCSKDGFIPPDAERDNTRRRGMSIFVCEEEKVEMMEIMFGCRQNSPWRIMEEEEEEKQACPVLMGYFSSLCGNRIND